MQFDQNSTYACDSSQSENLKEIIHYYSELEYHLRQVKQTRCELSFHLKGMQKSFCEIRKLGGPMWQFDNFSHFCEFWQSLGLSEGLSLAEAAEVYYNQENEVENCEQVGVYAELKRNQPSI